MFNYYNALFEINGWLLPQESEGIYIITLSNEWS